MRKHHWIVVALVIALALAACGGGNNEAEPVEEEAVSEPVAEAQPVGDAAHGKELFVPSCAACHGPEGEGVQGLGKDMTESEFIAEKTDAELLEFLKVGRAPDDPLNTTGVLMPPKGGNPALSDEDLIDIIAYIRTIHN
jgi:mono/diheme cytochrome c family protein